MLLTERIEADLRQAMKEKAQARVDCLRLLLAALKNRRIEKRDELDDAEVLSVLSKLAKQRQESIEMFEQGGRTDLAEKERAELAIIKGYLPEEIGDEELVRLVEETVQELGASGMKEMGRVMKALGPKISGRADGKKVSEAVKSKLSQSS